MTSFEELNLIGPLMRALKTEGYEVPTPIQERAIPYILQGSDILGCAQTGTGKTAAFALPILQNLWHANSAGARPRTLRTLVLTPTRELCIQIAESFAAYGRHTGLRHAAIYGGGSQKPQTDALRAGVDILIATPGRLLDLMSQRLVSLQAVTSFVLDEADRMLDMGFINDVRKVIAKMPRERQTLFFSATMPAEIRKLADDILTEPVPIAVTPVSSAVDTVEQRIYHVAKADKKALLHHVLKDTSIDAALVFTRTKHGADKVARDLEKAGIRAEAIHGNKSQGARQRALGNFKARKTRVLVATDIASRGIDVEGLSHVINFELPNEPETYVHRIGRTGRAGLSGIALSFCDVEERPYLTDITKLLARPIAAVEEHPYRLEVGAHVPVPAAKAVKRPGASGSRPPQRSNNANRGRRRYR